MIAGLDVGRRHDRSALVRLCQGGKVGQNGVYPGVQRVKDVRLGSGPLPVQARILVPLLRPCLLTAVDATGLGLGLAETLAEAGLPVLLVTIVAGWDVVSLEPGRCTAGKAWLMGRVSAALSGRQLHCDPSAAGAETLRSELSTVIPKWERTGHVRYEASAGHDDTVLALALALLAGDVHERQASQVPRADAHAG
jgi:hypothetical protein